MWFNEERNKCILTFPVESFALIYKDGKFLDEDSANFVAEEYSRGHSFFTYISDTADSLSSCCRLKNKLQTREFNYTNGNLGVQTGSKSVITLNLSRITQDWVRETGGSKDDLTGLGEHINTILSRVYKYHTAYNELLWEMYDCGLLPVYKAGFINLDKQYLTIGLNGLNQAAEFLGMKCNVNDDYRNFCQFIFGTIKDSNTKASGKYFGHKVTLNTECIPAESLAIKNYNWDKEDGYKVPEDTNLYASYIFKPNDEEISLFDKIILHSKEFAAEELSGGQAAHLNLSEHLSYEQYKKILDFAGKVGCNYFTFNVPNSECADCGFITKRPVDECPKCHSKHINYYDRVIGYLTKIKNWSEGRQIEQKTRIYQTIKENEQTT
jgi:ribonucleoside-triphosphate reductase